MRQAVALVCYLLASSLLCPGQALASQPLNAEQQQLRDFLQPPR